ncbi:MAG TPA: M23 family metallopeptidase [Chitinophagaceae bacterium]
MKPISSILFFGALLLLASCSAPVLGGLGKKNYHDQYARKLTDAGLKATVMGQQWFTAAEKALVSPQTVTLPYRQAGYFAPDQPRAVGLRFTGQRGAKLIFRLETKALDTFRLYTDLWRSESDGSPKLILSMDSSAGQFTHEIEDEDEVLVLRLQPELLGGGEYTLSISVGPSLAFPVAGGKARIGSIWGDPRDAGARRHEGIDIFAPRSTPVIAAADGTVHRVGDNNLGGKVIFLRPKGKNLSLYYAHLDSQLVSSGDRVSVGDTIGLVGNTGNARTTPPHLHFGIYAMGGAINPYTFVAPDVKQPGRISILLEELKSYYRTTKDIKVGETTLARHTLLLATDVNSHSLLAQTPDRKTVTLPVSSVQRVDNQLRNTKIRDTIPLLSAPHPSAPQKKELLPGVPVRVLGYYNEFAFVSGEAQEQGWIPRSQVR